MEQQSRPLKINLAARRKDEQVEPIAFAAERRDHLRSKVGDEEKRTEDRGLLQNRSSGDRQAPQLVPTPRAATVDAATPMLSAAVTTSNEATTVPRTLQPHGAAGPTSVTRAPAPAAPTGPAASAGRTALTPGSPSGSPPPPSRPPARAPAPRATPVPAQPPLRGSFRLRRGWSLGRLAAAMAALAALAVLLPALLASRSSPPPSPASAPAPPAGPVAPATAPKALLPSFLVPAAPELLVRVHLTHTGAVETLPLEEYVTGVLAAEMPADFELEALKAQAIAARTFIIRRLAAGDTSGVPDYDADVTDTVAHQAYLSKQDLEMWELNGQSEQLAKLERAVKETTGLIMTYQGQPITASFFSASGGYTENSEEYWTAPIPYLRSVPSPWEASIDPSFKETVTLPINEMFGKLGLRVPALSISTSTEQETSTTNKLFKILSVTTGHKVKDISIGGKVFTGREVREKLKLRSSQFTLRLGGDNVNITTYGYGHGVGMSQWGANGMAKAGYTCTQILKHYYTGISFRQASHILKS